MKNDLSKFLNLALSLMLSASATGAAFGQMPGAANGTGSSGPIDIVADEQEFAGDAVIARGKVRVTYKDSVILAPLATLFKDPSGNPNKAVFTGHPRLTQSRSKIDANTLTFEMQKQKIVAEGNAHSEVEIPADDNQDSSASGSKISKQSSPAAASAVPKQRVDDEDEGAPQAVTSSVPEKKQESKSAKPAEKIITDSERQEYDEASGRFEALGHVKVVHGEITVFADKLQLVYSTVGNKPETALFSGHVTASQGKNTTCADNMSYSLSTKRLQASGNVKSKVIQEKKETGKKSESGEPTAKADFFGAPAKASTGKSTNSSSISISAPVSGTDDKPLWVFSDSQDYSRDTGRVAAHGSVKVVSGEMYGCGPDIILTKKPDGRTDKIYFKGRSQISQPGRRWIADEIIYIMDEHKVIANGNARAMIIQGPDPQKPKHKTVPDYSPSQSKLAERNNGSKQSISASKIEAAK